MYLAGTRLNHSAKATRSGKSVGYKKYDLIKRGNRCHNMKCLMYNIIDGTLVSLCAHPKVRNTYTYNDDFDLSNLT